MSHGHGPNVGWLSSPRTGGQWPGVLLHHDAFLVHADPTVLQEPPGDLVVQVDGTSRGIDEILLIGGPGSGDRATAMIRLAQGGVADAVRSVAVDRVAVTTAWIEQRPLWPTLLELGVVPASWPDSTGPCPPPTDRPAAIAVKSVTAGPADWCTIFWWLC